MSGVPDAVEGERFQLSPRPFADAEWFGLDANPEGTIDVPFEDHYQEPPGPAGAWDEVHHGAGNTSGAAPIFMAGESTIIVIGNLVGDPEVRLTPSGAVVANFTIASTPRTFNRESHEWKDSETLFLRASVWREAAENVAGSLTKGMRVIASGRTKPRTYETKEGQKRTVVELEVDEIGPSLRNACAEVNRRSTRNGGAGFHGDNSQAGQRVTLASP